MSSMKVSKLGRKMITLFLALVLIVSYSVPTGIATAASMGNVSYEGTGLGSQFIIEGGVKKPAYCINKGRKLLTNADAYSNQRTKYVWNAAFDDGAHARSGMSNALAWALWQNNFDSNGTISRGTHEFTENDAVSSSACADLLAKILFYGYPNNASGDNFTQKQTQDAVYWVIYKGKNNTKYGNALVNKALASPAPSSYTLYVYTITPTEWENNRFHQWNQCVVNAEFVTEKWKVGTTANVEGRGSASSGSPLTIQLKPGQTSTGGLTLSDSVKYEGVPAGQTFAIRTRLMRVNDDGSTTLIRARNGQGDGYIGGFSAPSANGVWSGSNLTMWGVDLEPGKYVFFESVRNESTGYTVTHEDINDNAQTIIVKPASETQAPDPIELKFQLTKKLTGEGAPTFLLNDGMFEFTLKGSNPTGATITSASRLTANAGVDSTPLRRPLAVKITKAGDYTFEIAETQDVPSASTVDPSHYEGVEFSKEKITLDINVVEEGGKLVATVKANGTELEKKDEIFSLDGNVEGYEVGTFTNKYAEPEPVFAALTLKKVLDGANAPASLPEFKFNLEKKAGQPEGATITNGTRWTNSSGNLYNPFNIKFEKEGYYTFVVKETTDTNNKGDYTGVSFDAEDKEITFEVKRDGNNLRIESAVGASYNINKKAYEFSKVNPDNPSEIDIDPFKNTYAREVVKTTVKKVWNDGTSDVTWPDEVAEPITVKVAYGSDSQEIELTKENYASGVETKEFTKEAGAQFQVTEETSISGYDGVVTGNATDGFVVTNTKQKPDEPVYVKLMLSKGTNGDEFKDPKLPEFMFKLTGVTAGSGTDYNILPYNGSTYTTERVTKYSGDHELWNPFYIEFKKAGTYEFKVSEVALADMPDALKAKYDYTGFEFNAPEKTIKIEVEKDASTNILSVNTSACEGVEKKGNDFWVAGGGQNGNFENTYHQPKIGTTASGASGNKILPGEGTVVINDEIAYEGLKPNTTYTVSAELHKRTKDISGQVNDGGTVDYISAEGLTFTTGASNAAGNTVSGTHTVTFTVDAAKLAGQTLVAFEEVQQNGATIAVHARIEDENQTVYIPEIKTTATNETESDTANKGSHKIGADVTGEITIKDVVEYRGLIPGKTYTMTGQLHLKSDASQTVGSAVASDPFTVDNTGAGTVTIEFKLNPADYANLKGDAVVAFEECREGAAEIATHADINDVAQTVEFEKKTYPVEISKHSITGSAELPGAYIKVTNEAGRTVDQWWSTNESHVMKNVEPGKYFMQEQVAPVGYDRVTTKIGFTVGDDGTVTVDSATVSGDEVEVDGTNHLILKDSPKKYDVKISKKALGGDEIAGAQMTVTSADGSFKDSWTSDGKPHEMRNLAPGVYTMEEIVAPSGYKKINTKITFTVTITGDVTVENATVDNGGKITIEDGNHLILEDAPQDYPVKISKKVLGGDEIEGAQLKVTKDGNTIEEWTSTKKSHDFTVNAGEYELEEVVAPEGMKRVTTKIKFTVDANGKVTLANATVDNGGKISVLDTNHLVLEDAPTDSILAVKKTSNVKEAKVGDVIPYTITIENSGSANAKGVEIRDTMDSNLSYVSDDSNGVRDGQTVTWTVDVAAGETKTIKINCKINKGAEGKIVNRVKILNTKFFGSVTEESDSYLVDLPGDADDATDDTDKTPGDGSTDGKPSPHGPGTGDNTDLVLWIMLVLTAAAVIPVMRRLRRDQ